MDNILFIAPFEGNGRFKGGIASYASSIINDKEFETDGFSFEPISNCQIQRKATSGGRLSFENIKNYFAVKKVLKKKLKEKHYDIAYLNSSRNIALLKDLLLAKFLSKKGLKVIFHIHFANINEVLHKNPFIRKISIKLLKKIPTKIISLSY